MIFLVKSRSVVAGGKLHVPGDLVELTDPLDITHLLDEGIVISTSQEAIEAPKPDPLPEFAQLTRRDLISTLGRLKASYRVKFTSVELYELLEKLYKSKPFDVLKALGDSRGV